MLLGNWVSIRVFEYFSNPKIIIPFTFTQLNRLLLKEEFFLEHIIQSYN